MKKVRLVTLSLMLFFMFAVSISFAEHGDMQTIEGNIICLLPDYEKGNVNPVIANKPCDGLAPHAHILVTKEGTVYALQGLEGGLQKIEKSPERNNVKITGRVEGNPRGWVLYVM